MNRLERIRGDIASGYGVEWRDQSLLLAVAEAAVDWLAAIEGFRDMRIPVTKTREVANAAQRRMADAVASLLEDSDD